MARGKCQSVVPQAPVSGLRLLGNCEIMNSELRKWLLALGVVLSSCSFPLGFLPAAEAAEPPAENTKGQEETLYFDRPPFTIYLSHSRRTIWDSHSPFAVHYSPHTGAFLVTPPDPASAYLTPNDFNQVSTSVFDPVNNAIRVNASLSPGGTHTPNDANQVFTSIFDPVNNAVKVNCVIGCGTSPGGSSAQVEFNNAGAFGGTSTVLYNTATGSLTNAAGFSYPATTIDVNQVAPGVASSAGGTITLTNASNTATTSVAWNANTVGSILNYTGVTPNFRAVVLAVSGTTLTLAAYYPGTTVTSTSSWTSTGNDSCARMQAAILNNPNLTWDAQAVTGANCSISPTQGMPLNASGGKLILGQWQPSIWRNWEVPPETKIIGQGRPGSGVNTFIAASNSTCGSMPCYTTQYGAYNATSSGVTISGSTFTDTNATFEQAISSASCISGTNYGQFALSGALTGLVEGVNVLITGAGSSWSGGSPWPVIAVAGNTATIEFASTCVTPSLSSAEASVVYGNVLQASFAGKATGALTLGSFANGALVLNDSASDFIAADVGACTVNFTFNSTNYVYDILAQSGSSVTLHAPASLALSSNAFTKTCWDQFKITGISSLTAVTAPANWQYPTGCSGCGSSVTYSIGKPLIAVSYYAPNGGSTQGTTISDLGLSCNALSACSGIQLDGAQENGEVRNLVITGWTAYGMTCDIDCEHHGPESIINLVPANSAPPTAAGVINMGTANAGATRAFEGFSITANTNGSDPFVGFEIGNSAVNYRGNHCEQIPICYSVGRYGEANVFGVTIQGDPGVAGWDGVKFWTGARIAANVLGLWGTNTEGNALIEDANVGPGCGSGTTLINDLTSVGGSGRASPGAAAYILDTSGASIMRLTSSPEAANCLQGTANGLQCFSTTCGGSNVSSSTLTLTMTYGNQVDIQLAASVSTLTINNPVTGQGMDLVIQENTTGGFTFAFPSNFKGFTAITTTASECNVYHAQYDGTNWIQVGAANIFAGPCL
jgi:hypothetical protein